MSPARKQRSSLAPTIPAERFELSCGAQLIVSPRRDAPVLAVQAHVRGGHLLDPAVRDGLAFLTGHLIDQGTGERDEEAIAALLEPCSGSLAGDSSGASGAIVASEWRTLLDLLCDALTRPTYPRAGFERQKARLLDRLVVERDEPRVRGGWLFRSLVYGDHWLGRSDRGTVESVQGIERRDVRAFHRKNWVAARTLIAVCGDVDPKAVYRFLDRRLGGWKRGRALPRPTGTFPAPGRRREVFRADRQQVHLHLGHLGVTRRDEDYPTLVVMDHILGTGPGFTSRITRRLRDELGLAYTVHAAIHDSAGTLPGTFTAYIGTSPEHVTTAVEGFLDEIRRIQAEPPTAAELDLVKDYLTGSFVLGFERAAQRTRYLVYAERNGLPDGHLDELVARFGDVTAEEVRAAAARHLMPERACLVAAGPVARRELSAAYPARPRGGRRAARAR